MNPDQIREAIAYLDAVMRDMTLDPEGNVRALTPEDQTRFDEGFAERGRLNTQLGNLERVAGLAPVSGVQGDNPGLGVPALNRNADPFDLSDLRFTATEADVRARAITALEVVRGLNDSQREHVTERLERLGGELIGRVLATGSDVYRSAAQKLMVGMAHMLTEEERSAITRAQSLTDAAGGYAIPFTLDPTIMLTNAGSISPLRQWATVTPIVTDAWHGISSAGAVAAYHAEAAEVGDNSITIAQPAIPVHRMDIFVPFSFEISQDWVGFETEMHGVMLDAKTIKENEKFTVGSGTDEPKGFVTALAGSASEVAPTTAETFAVADLYKMEEAVPPRFRANARWLANKSIYNLTRQFGTTDGANLWVRLDAATPSTLVGYQAGEASDMDGSFNVAATATNYVLAFGDWAKGFRIVDRVGMNFELVPHLFATANNRPSGQRGFLAWCRNGSDVQVLNALRLLNLATAA